MRTICVSIGNWYADVLTLDTASPRLNAAIKSLNEIQRLCERLGRKISALGLTERHVLRANFYPQSETPDLTKLYRSLYNEFP